jgi:hypothetical protein
MLQLTAISNLDPPQTSFEMIYMICNYLTGVLLFGIIVGNVTNIINDLNMKRTMVNFGLNFYRKNIRSDFFR